MSETETRRARATLKSALRADLAAARAESARLRGVVEAVQALADEPGSGFPYVRQAALRAALAPVSSSGEALCDDPLCETGPHKHRGDSTEYVPPSSGEAESGEGEARGREPWEVYRDAFQAVSAERDALRELLDLAARPVLSREAIARAATRAHFDVVRNDATRAEIRDAGLATADAVLALLTAGGEQE